jgi:hypothetical protein
MDEKKLQLPQTLSPGSYSCMTALLLKRGILYQIDPFGVPNLEYGSLLKSTSEGIQGRQPNAKARRRAVAKVVQSSDIGHQPRTVKKK